MSEINHFEQKAREVEARIHQNRKKVAAWEPTRQKVMAVCVLLTIIFVLLTVMVWVFK